MTDPLPPTRTIRPPLPVRLAVVAGAAAFVAIVANGVPSAPSVGDLALLAFCSVIGLAVAVDAVRGRAVVEGDRLRIVRTLLNDDLRLEDVQAVHRRGGRGAPPPPQPTTVLSGEAVPGRPILPTERPNLIPPDRLVRFQPRLAAGPPR